MRSEPLRVPIAEDETVIRLDLEGLPERNGLRVCGEARRFGQLRNRSRRSRLGAFFAQMRANADRTRELAEKALAKLEAEERKTA